MKKLLLPIIVISSFVSAQAPAGYYDGTAGLTGYKLKSRLHDIVSDKNVNWHYSDLPNLYNQTDLDKYYDHGSANTTILLDMYSENPAGADAYEYTSANLISTSGAEGLGYNREHAVPQSTFNSNYPMYSDLHFVIPTDARINQLRNNYPYGVGNSTVHYTFTNSSKIANSAIPNYVYTNRVYEPLDEFKGDIARMLLYFAVRYEDKLPSFNYFTNINPAIDRSPLDGTAERAFDPAYISMLLQWHLQDPVSQREIDRNNAIYTIQKNRNPFIDDPQWVNSIWMQTPDAVAPQAPLNLNSTQSGAYYTQLGWSPSSSSDVIGYNIYQNNVLVGTTKSTSIVIDHLTPSTSYSFTVKAYDQGYLQSPDSNALTVSTSATDINSKDLFIVKYIEGTGNNKALEIVNRTGHEVDLNNYSIRVQYYNNSSGSYYYGNSFELEGKIPNNQNFVILNPKSALSCYTNNDARFLTAGEALTFAGTQYVELAYKSTTVDAIGSKFVSNSYGDVSLYRKNTVNQPTSTFTLGEWDSYSVNYCQNLGGTLSTTDLITSGKEFKIYPNPVNEDLFISGEIKDVKMAQIIDLSGKIIYTEKEPFKTKKNISVQNLSAGLYFLKLDDKAHQFIKK
ncbi:endonuclease I [Chryseobacterium shigense]|uniref:Por secretion system C-terminal sorting domain-containing protein n=1 Tax=Chryseobacterium shigense TaxID=297244 RepID=A0A1N7HTE1_9FLAO|nr:endonuclease [Chryseobacterium shigense]PQA93095.1 endonuclease I [Chryseobacterium shigense]SIS28124.1 Por secretion system C-terminal sorting domain-containing protein [Chryseobacterium shigense]